MNANKQQRRQEPRQEQEVRYVSGNKANRKKCECIRVPPWAFQDIPGIPIGAPQEILYSKRTCLLLLLRRHGRASLLPVVLRKREREFTNPSFNIWDSNVCGVGGILVQFPVWIIGLSLVCTRRMKDKKKSTRLMLEFQISEFL